MAVATRDWERIRQDRPDLTDYVIHWTREDPQGGTALENLSSILTSGALFPDFGARNRIRTGRRVRTIHGPYPAVCFTEQPLYTFEKSTRILPSRYVGCGVAVRRQSLYEYGGRPVIYGDDLMLANLPEESKHLWVRFNPVPFDQYPADWTHEREWRTRAYDVGMQKIGLLGADRGVPILLPDDLNQHLAGNTDLRILVPDYKTAGVIDGLLERLFYDSSHTEDPYLRQYYARLNRLMLFPLSEVRKRIAAGDQRWAKIETIPLDELF